MTDVKEQMFGAHQDLLIARVLDAKELVFVPVFKGQKSLTEFESAIAMGDRNWAISLQQLPRMFGANFDELSEFPVL